MVSETKEKEAERSGLEDKTGKPGSVSEEVAEARAHFLETAGEYEPLGIVRKHPFLSLGGAFVVGIGMNRLIRNASYLSFLPVSLQIATLTAKIGLLAMDLQQKTSARNSAG